MGSLDRRRGRRGYSWSAYGHAAGSGVKKTAKPRASGASIRQSLRKNVPMALVLCGVLFVFGFATLTQVAESTRVAKEVSTLRAQLSKYNSDNALLEKDIAELENATRIQSLAVNRLGLVQPVSEQYVQLPEQTVAASSPADNSPASTTWINAVLRALGGV